MPSRRRLLAGAALVVLAGVVAAVVLFVYTPPAAPAETPVDATTPEPPYRVSTSIAVNGEVFVAYAARADGDGERQIVRRSFENATYTTYWNATHSLTHVDADRDVEYERFLETDDDVVWRDDDAMEAITVVAGADPPLANQTQPEGLAASVLGLPGYEAAGTETYAGGERTVYRPRMGWYETGDPMGGSQQIRVTNASGELYVDPDTGVTYFADIRFDTARGDSWGAYLFSTYVERERATTHVTHEYDPAPVDVDVERPGWADRM